MPKTWDSRTLIHVIRKSDTKKALTFLEQGSCIEAEDGDGSTALMVSAEEGLQEIVEYLLDHGANVNAVNEKGETALMNAAKKGHQEIVKLLLDDGANIDAVTHDQIKLSPVSLLSDNGVKEVIEKGETALMLALKKGYKDIAKLLIDHGANTDAEKHGHQEIAKPLLGGTNIDAVKHGQIEQSPDEDILDIPTFLRDQGVKAVNEKGETAELVLDNGEKDNIHYKDIDNYPYISSFVSIPNILQKFLDNGMDINLSDENDNSLLVAAVNADNIESIKFFLKNKADINYKNFDGETPLSFARSDEIKELLTNKGAIDSKCNYCSEEYSSYYSHKKGFDGFCSQDCSFKADEPMREKMRLEHEAKEAKAQRKRDNIMAREERIRQENEREKQRDERRKEEAEREEEIKREKREKNWQMIIEKREEAERQSLERQCKWCGKKFQMGEGYSTSYVGWEDWCSKKCCNEAKIHNG